MISLWTVTTSSVCLFNFVKDGSVMKASDYLIPLWYDNSYSVYDN